MNCTAGIGAYKLAANYAPGVMVQKEAAKKGYAQNLWIHAVTVFITAASEIGEWQLSDVVADRRLTGPLAAQRQSRDRPEATPSGQSRNENLLAQGTLRVCRS